MFGRDDVQNIMKVGDNDNFVGVLKGKEKLHFERTENVSQLWENKYSVALWTQLEKT